VLTYQLYIHTCIFMTICALLHFIKLTITIKHACKIQINNEKKYLNISTQEHTERLMQECVLSSNNVELNIFQFTILMRYFNEHAFFKFLFFGLCIRKFSRQIYNYLLDLYTYAPLNFSPIPASRLAGLT